jgi:hypothetical protein
LRATLRRVSRTLLQGRCNRGSTDIPSRFWPGQTSRWPAGDERRVARARLAVDRTKN